MKNKKAYLLLFSLLFVFCCTESICIGDCSFDISVDTGLLIYQPSDFNNTRVRIKVPGKSFTVSDGEGRVKYRDIDSRIPVDTAIMNDIRDLPDADIYLYIQITEGSMVLRGISYKL